MKHLFITIIVLLSSVSYMSSQFRFDIVGGVSPGASPSSAGLIVNRHLPHEEFVFNMKKVDPQIFAGLKGQVQLGAPFFLESGLMYTRQRATYDVVYTIIDTEHPVAQHSMNETDHIIMLPLNSGVNKGYFDITSGFGVMKSINNKNDLQQITGFNYSNQPFRFGWQSSVGFDILRSRIGLEYQGSFSRVGSGMFVNGQSLELMNVPGQFVL